VSKELLTKVLRDDEEGIFHPHSDFPVTSSSSFNGAPLQRNGANSEAENEEDENEEPSSEDRSESTVISPHKINLKSIESSTDTLVAELGFGFSADPKLPLTNGDAKPTLEARATLETDLTHLLGEDDYSSHQTEQRLDQNEDALSDIEISLLNSNLSSLAVETGSNHHGEGPTTEKLLPDDMEYITSYSGIETLHGHQNQCTVCEQSKAVLRHVQNHDNFQMVNGSGNPSSVSSGIGTISYPSKLSLSMNSAFLSPIIACS